MSAPEPPPALLRSTRLTLALYPHTLALRRTSTGNAQYAFVDYLTREAAERCKSEGLQLGGRKQEVEDRLSPSFSGRKPSLNRGAGPEGSRGPRDGGRGPRPEGGRGR